MSRLILHASQNNTFFFNDKLWMQHVGCEPYIIIQQIVKL
jgi:hypothetical protein